MGLTLGSTVLAFIMINKWIDDTYRATGIALTNLLQILVGAIALPLMGLALNFDIYDYKGHTSVFSIGDYRAVFGFIIVGSVISLVFTFFIRDPDQK